MALVPFSELLTLWQSGADRAVTIIEAGTAREAALREQLTAAGLPDDQVPPAPQEDTAALEFLSRLGELDATETPEPGGDVEVPGELPVEPPPAP